MAFASSSSTTPTKPVIESNSYYCNLGPDSEPQKSPLTRHARHAEQHDLPLQSSSHTVYDITAAGTNISLGCPSSWSTTPNVSHPSRSLNDVKNGGEPYLSSALSSPELPPLTDNNFLTSVTTTTSKNKVSSSHSKNHFLLDLKRFNPTIILQNCGCVARDHLSSERTFLAYVHTSLCLSSAGVAIFQLLTITDFTISKYSEIPMLEVRMRRFAIPLGVVSQVLALCVLFLGVYRYFVVQRALPKNMFPVARLSIAFLSFVFGVLVVVVFWAIWID